MRFLPRPTLHSAPGGRACTAVLVVLAASVAALAAHIGIDVFGDVMLPHDTYDDIAHQSRTVMMSTALVLIGGAALRFLLAALDAARPGPYHRRANAIGEVTARRTFVALVVGAAFALVVGMEFVDSAFAGLPCDDIGDLLGGSIPLGSGVTLASALAVALAAVRVARWATIAHGMTVRKFGTWFVRRCRPASSARSVRRLRFRPSNPLIALMRNVTRRGPPLASP